jgi:hypothetical protein
MREKLVIQSAAFIHRSILSKRESLLLTPCVLLRSFIVPDSHIEKATRGEKNGVRASFVSRIPVFHSYSFIHA